MEGKRVEMKLNENFFYFQQSIENNEITKDSCNYEIKLNKKV